MLRRSFLALPALPLLAKLPAVLPSKIEVAVCLAVETKPSLRRNEVIVGVDNSKSFWKVARLYPDGGKTCTHLPYPADLDVLLAEVRAGVPVEFVGCEVM